MIKNRIDLKKVEELILGLGLTQKSQQMVSELSVGEAQRVAIARGLANSPKVIFADEPTSALDDYNTQKVIELILDQTTGITKLRGIWHLYKDQNNEIPAFPVFHPAYLLRRPANKAFMMTDMLNFKNKIIEMKIDI